MLEFIDVLTIKTMDRFSFSDVAKFCHLSHEEAQELIDYGAIKSDYTIGSECFFSAQRLSLLQNACKQRSDYDLDLFSIVISVQYLEHIEELNAKIKSLQAMTSLVSMTLV